ncbi:MAG: MATE family efflux transporter [Lachnospiraceae bacterium]|nr:MATE family efflux transporter [Lachnospiraceae bacterium]
MIQDLTEGDPQKTLIGYTLPMFISVVFQQFYNMADSMIAGRFAGEDALAAVGASYPITMIFMAVAVGSNIGCSVVLSQLFGAKAYAKVRTAVTTILLTGAILAAVLTIAGVFTTPVMMRMIQTPENIFADGALYLKIYIGGFVFLFLYNVTTGMFNSLGDSKTPLYFLIGSSLGNIGLDLLFVAVFSWGVAGVAWATFIAQGIACVLALLSFRKRLRELKCTERAPLFSFSLLKKISLIAVPSILQQSFVSVGNIFIQGLVNSYGSGVIAGYSAAIRLNTFVITGFSTLGNGVSGFTAQNLGAGHFERIRDGFKAGLKMAFLVAAPFFAAYFFLGRLMMQFFLEDTGSGALQTGVIFLRIVSPFYFVAAVKLVADGVLRGAERMRQFMASTFTDRILRVLLAFLFSGVLRETGIWLSWPVGWSIAAAMSWIFCQKVLQRRKQENIETKV